MIVEVGDGRELRVPDSWTDAQARAFATAYRRGEIGAEEIAAAERARDSEIGVQQLILEELRAIKQVLLADRQMVPDPTTGELTRSKVIIRRNA